MSGRSRYPRSIEHAASGMPVRTRVRTALDGGSPIAYLGRTLLPRPGALQRQSTYTVKAGDRIDNLAAVLLGDPALYWMLLEANGVGAPESLCALPGRQIAVPAATGQGRDPFDQPRATPSGVVARPMALTADSQETP